MTTTFLRAATVAAVMLVHVTGVSLAQDTRPAAPSHQHGHAGHGDSQEKKTGATPSDPAQYPPGIPAVTDDDRAAAFPQLNGQHSVHDDAVHYYVLFDQIEWQTRSGATGGSWDNKGWVGRDVNRLWFRTEGDVDGSGLADVQAQVFYGRAIHRWWEVVAGVRQDFRGPSRTWAAVGLQGLAPYWFEVEATAYIGEAGRTHVRLEAEYDLLFTNRLILQPAVELELYGKSDPERAIGTGLSSADMGLRLRYEWRRELAPYIGVTWHRKYFGTADLAEAAGEDKDGATVALGMRIWF